MTLSNTPRPPDRDDDYSPAGMDHDDQVEELTDVILQCSDGEPMSPGDWAAVLVDAGVRANAVITPDTGTSVEVLERHLVQARMALISLSPESGEPYPSDAQIARTAKAIATADEAGYERARRRPAPSLKQALGDPGSYTKRRTWQSDGVTEYERVIDWQERAVRIAMGEQDIDR